MLDLRKLDGESGNSKGNLIKWEILLPNDRETTYIKTGRQQTREYPTNFGIEPVIEVICYEFAKILKINCAKQELDVAIINHYTDEVLTLVNKSIDFKKGNQFFEFGNISNLLGGPIRRNFESIVSNLKNEKELITMILFDLLIMNEDRHDFNFGYLVKSAKIQFSPIYDNGYSLLYDDMRGLFGDYTKAVKLCNCPSFYHSFHEAETIVRKFKQRNDLRELCNINVRTSTVYKMLEEVYKKYKTLVNRYKVNNIPLNAEWFKRVGDFLIWRLNHVRDL